MLECSMEGCKAGSWQLAARERLSEVATWNAEVTLYAAVKLEVTNSKVQ